jgi:polyisoprenoid-binding protein YceI
LVGAAVVVVVLIVGAIGIIKLIQGKGDPELTLNDAPTVPAQADSSTTAPSGGSTSTVASSSDGIAGTWKIASGSQVGYRVKETLFGQSTTATGRTTSVTGNLTIDGTAVTNASFTVQMADVTSDRSQRDGQFRGRIMEVDQFPTATFELTSPITLPSVPAIGTEVHEKATGKLTLHGTTKTVTFTVNARRVSGGIQVQGQIPVTFADYNIDNPSGGPASVGNDGTLEFALSFSRA